jgi:hypothetical protein
MSLSDQILDAFPSGNYGLQALLRVLDIVETTEVETAAVDCLELPLLRINPAFAATFANTPEKLLMLVMHELHHILLGHTRLFLRVTPLDNLIFDAVINALLCRMFSNREYTSFFTGFYSDQRFPECFLRPPEGWRPSKPARIPPSLRKKGLTHLQGLYRALYSDQGADYKELYDALTQAMPNHGAEARLLGSHGQDIGELSGALFEAVRQVVEHWPQPPNPIKGRSWSSVLEETRVGLVRGPSNREVLRGLLRKVARAGTGSSNGRLGFSSVKAMSPLPAFDRRTVVLRALGVPTLLYPCDVLHWGRQPLEPVHVYLDVSGSIGDLKGALYGAVLDCREMVYRKIHLFSTVVHDITPEQLRLGECQTTGGTSIECVAGHMQANGVRRAVIITDGYVGTPGETARQTLSQAHVAVALTPDSATRTDLENVVRHWAELKESRHEN